MAEKVRRVQFAVPSEYERQRAEAERRRLMAEMLAQQEYDPGQFPGAPIPKAAPLVQGLQSFLKAYSTRKAKEAEEGARTADIESARELVRQLGPQERVAAPDMFADPEAMASKYAQPRMETYTPNEQERQDLLLQAAIGGSPRSAQLAQMLMSQKPEREEFGTTPQYDAQGRAFVVGKGGNVRYLEGVTKAPEQEKLPTSVQEYNFAKSQGFTGSYADWERQNRAAGATRIVMPSEGERKDAYNLGRIVTAQRQITQAVAKDPSAFAPGGLEALVESAPGDGAFTYLTQSPQRQIVAAAQGDMIDALLTLATGAAYTKEQLAQQRQSYLPRWNESDTSKRAKVERLYDLAQQARVRAGRAWTPELDTAIDEAFQPFLQAPEKQNLGLTPDQEKRLRELEQKALSRGAGGPK